MFTKKHSLALVACLAILALPALMSAQQSVTIDRVDHIFRNLQPGQPLQLKEVGDRYQLTLLDKAPDGDVHRVLNYGWDYVEVGDGMTVTMIPVSSIKSIVRQGSGEYAKVKGWSEKPSKKE